jgi:hypothetical protein
MPVPAGSCKSIPEPIGHIAGIVILMGVHIKIYDGD